MKIYIDLYFMFNFIMDMIVLFATSSLLKRRCKIGRIITSSVVGGVVSILLFTSGNRVLLEIIGIIIMTLICFGFKGIRYFITNVFYSYLISTLLGGVMYLFNIKVTSNSYINYLIIIVISVEVVILYLKEMNKIKDVNNNYYRVDIYFRGMDKISLMGYLDTGNNLYDPYKHRPIILVSSKYYIDGNFVLVPYNTIDNSGMLKCIKPEMIFIEGVGYKGNTLVSFMDRPILIEGVDVILHKDLIRRG